MVFTLIIIRVSLSDTMSEVSGGGGCGGGGGGRTRTSEFHGQTIGGTDYNYNLNLRPVAISVSVARSQAHDRTSLDMVYDVDRKDDRSLGDVESGASGTAS